MKLRQLFLLLFVVLLGRVTIAAEQPESCAQAQAHILAFALHADGRAVSPP
jgi:hypothetical protein